LDLLRHSCKPVAEEEKKGGGIDKSIFVDIAFGMSQTLTQDVTRAARLFHALADETRLQIVEFLSRGEQCVCDLTDALETGQSRLSFHLKILKEAGLIRDRREGRWNYYSLAPEAFEEVAKLVGAMKDGTKLFTKPSRCCG
jgi:ArsR family transcriptional regulator